VLYVQFLAITLGENWADTFTYEFKMSNAV